MSHESVDRGGVCHRIYKILLCFLYFIGRLIGESVGKTIAIRLALWEADLSLLTDFAL